MKVGFRLLIFLGVLSVQAQAFAVRFQIPYSTTGNIQLINNSNQEISVYKKLALDNGFEQPNWEEMLTLPARTKRTLHLQAADLPGLFYSPMSTLQISVQKTDKSWISIFPESSQLQRVRAQTSGEAQIYVTNFSGLKQNAVVRYYDSVDMERVELKLALEPYRTSKANLKITGLQTIEIKAEAPIRATLESNHDEFFSVPLKNQVPPLKSSESVFFRLENSEASQSFVAEFNDPKLIEKARSQIREPEKFQGRILIAELAQGSNSVNYDERGMWKSSWSWHVSRVHKFAELASQACDGSPSFIEDIFPFFFSDSYNGGSRIICFWGYRVTEEIAP